MLQAKQKILLVSNAASALSETASLISENGWDVTTATESLVDYLPDLKEVGLVLAVLDSPSECRKLCWSIRRHSHIPIVVQSENLSPEEDADILDSGADECLPGGCAKVLITAHIKALFRRSEFDAADRIRWDGIRVVEVPVGTHRLRVDGGFRDAFLDEARLGLSRLDFNLLQSLVVRSGNLIPRDALYRRVWGYATEGSGHCLEQAVYRLKAKLGTHGIRIVLESAPGIGYRLVGITAGDGGTATGADSGNDAPEE